MSVPVPDGEHCRGFLQLLSKATHFPIAVLKQQITRHLCMVVELRTKGPGSYAGAPPFIGRQEGELDCDVCVNSHTGKVAESFILFRYKPEIQNGNRVRKLWSLTKNMFQGKMEVNHWNSTQESFCSLLFCSGLPCISV